MRLRFYGPRNLIEDASEKSEATTLVCLHLVYRFDSSWEVTFDVFNLLDTHASDIDDYYASRLPGEPATGVDDLHSHPSAPREFRGGVTWHFQ